MKTEENKRMFALSCIVADLKAENMELVQRVQQLADEYNEVVRQLNSNEKRNFIGMELNKEYFDIAQNRISSELKNQTLL